jgi:hypothetical protein
MNDAPIWDPRMYFLHVVAIWANLIVQEYTGLVRKLEKLVNVSVALTLFEVSNADFLET